MQIADNRCLIFNDHHHHPLRDSVVACNEETENGKAANEHRAASQRRFRDFGGKFEALAIPFVCANSGFEKCFGIASCRAVTYSNRVFELYVGDDIVGLQIVIICRVIEESDDGRNIADDFV